MLVSFFLLVEEGNEGLKWEKMFGEADGNITTQRKIKRKTSSRDVLMTFGLPFKTSFSV